MSIRNAKEYRQGMALVKRGAAEVNGWRLRGAMGQAPRVGGAERYRGRSAGGVVGGMPGVAQGCWHHDPSIGAPRQTWTLCV